MPKRLVKLIFTVLLGGFLCATLVRFAPGFAVSEEMMDTRRSGESLDRMRTAREEIGDLPKFYARFLLGYVRGDLGVSELFGRPVRALIADRASATVQAAGVGLAVGWAFALLIAIPAAHSRNWILMALSRSGGGLMQCVPAGVLALLLLAGGSRGILACGLAIGFVVFPRVIQLILNLFEQAYAMPHVQAARARGMKNFRIFLAHVTPTCLPQTLALGGVSVSIALSAAIPMEMILDVPGIGQLAWQAALSRDLVLLVNITMMLAVIITTANALSGWAGSRAS